MKRSHLFTTKEQAMSHMEHEITDKELWYVVDGPYRTEYIPADLLGHVTKDLHIAKPEDSESWQLSAWEELQEYCDNTNYWTIDLVEGYGARCSAPGYLDATEWSVFPTAEEAQEYLDEYYPEEEEEEL
jgi:hypothetical protein